MDLIKEEKSIRAAITGLGKRLKNLDKDSHIIAVRTITHALANSHNWNVVSELAKVIGGYDESCNKFKSRAIRAKDFRNWIGAHLPVQWEYKNGVGRYITDKKKKKGFNAEQCLEDIMVPWFEKIKDEGAPLKFISPQARIESVLKAIAKDKKKYDALSEEQQATVEYNEEVNDKAVKALLDMINFEVILGTDATNDSLTEEIKAHG